MTIGIKDFSKGDQIKADLYSRPNNIEGKYKAGQIFGLDNFEEIKDDDIFFLETLKIRADSADRIIAEAEAQGKNTNDPYVMKELGEQINALGKPIHKNESITTAILVSLQLMLFYGIAVGIWGLFFKKGFLGFGLFGVIVGLLISLLFVVLTIPSLRTKKRAGDMVFFVTGTWGNLGIFIGVVGLIAWAIRSIFFR